MKNQTLLFLAVITLGLAAYFYFLDEKLPGTAERERDKQQVLVFDDAKINRVELANASGNYLISQRDGKDWALEKPIAYPAESPAVQNLLSELAMAHRQATLDKGSLQDYQASLEAFGLVKPVITLSVSGGGESCSLLVGKETAREGTYYALARNGEDESVMVIDGALQSLLTGELDAWRSRRVFDFAVGDISGYLLRQGEQEAEVVLKEKNWELLKPLNAPANSRSVEAFNAYVAGLKAADFISDEAGDLAVYGLTSPQAILEISTSGDKKEAVKSVLRIGQEIPDQKGFHYAQLGERPTVFTIPAAAVERISGLVNEVRDKRIVRFDKPMDISAIVLKEKELQLQVRQLPGEKNIWDMEGLKNVDGSTRHADGDLITQFLVSMGSVETLSFEPKTEENIRKHGLDSPQLEMRLSNSDRKDAVNVLKLGRSKAGKLFADVSWQPMLLELPESVLSLFPKSSYDWYGRSVVLVERGNIQSIKWEDLLSGKTLELARGSNGAWPDKSGEQVIDADFLGRQLQALETLTALGWMPAEKMTGTVSSRVTLKDKEGKILVLLLAEPAKGAPDTMAMFQGDSAAFLLPVEACHLLQTLPVVTAAPVAPASIPPVK